jgi:hypothetical protein
MLRKATRAFKFAWGVFFLFAAALIVYHWLHGDPAPPYLWPFAIMGAAWCGIAELREAIFDERAF